MVDAKTAKRNFIIAGIVVGLIPVVGWFVALACFFRAFEAHKAAQKGGVSYFSFRGGKMDDDWG